MKISAAKIYENLHIDGIPLIPKGSYVYIATDDPDGLCSGCTDNGNVPCTQFKPPLPLGCMEDVSLFHICMTITKSRRHHGEHSPSKGAGRFAF